MQSVGHDHASAPQARARRVEVQGGAVIHHDARDRVDPSTQPRESPHAGLDRGGCPPLGVGRRSERPVDLLLAGTQRRRPIDGLGVAAGEDHDVDLGLRRGGDRRPESEIGTEPHRGGRKGLGGALRALPVPDEHRQIGVFLVDRPRRRERARVREVERPRELDDAPVWEVGDDALAKPLVHGPAIAEVAATLQQNRAGRYELLQQLGVVGVGCTDMVHRAAQGVQVCQISE
ncbi:hypothetical protein HQ604_15770 [Rhodococcus corynebacterioides]|uniref:Uncharacterized protein n=1 Tax=Rhodococcoides corynebacterioides TaxID=53972 RepID=A0ABS7P7V2_9NOCA|nr:hypothetical protein [Rhodococcus corynebacterioides]MBY6368502.1 hypothetical protein [Rhodococcus corynebacterioides]MBY6409359.1 hypothetical protein [Rhodococcus corynebacterioides]